MIRVFSDREVLSIAAAALFAAESRRAVEARGRFTVLLAGGETPRRAYRLLASPPWRERVPWRDIHVFWGDERCVPPDDPRNNAAMARRALLDRVPIPPDQLHPILCSRDSRRAAAAYEELLRTFFADRTPRFDLVFLGLGENGHTASLFPGTPVVAEQARWVAGVNPAGEEVPRVTLTAPVINQAVLVAFLVAGENKAAALKEALEGNPDPRDLPARLIRPVNGELIWLVDRAAARLLCRETAAE